MKKTLSAWQGAILLAFLFLSGIGVKAEGSKDLYPQNATGYRAVLRSSDTADGERWPFPTRGTHYVYAKAGEHIALASSAQNGSNSLIKLYKRVSKGDEEISLTSNTYGQIKDRAAELAGPKLSTDDNTTNRYIPIYYTVPTGGEGIYRVEFLARGTGNHNATILAASDWAQDGTAAIYAWDISVIKSDRSAFVRGRVYTNVLNLSNGNTGSGTTTPQANGWYGKIYALTKDGYLYRINNNGNNGIWFSFFVNNHGFLGNDKKPLYKSIPSLADVGTKTQDPRKTDTPVLITHKLFYNTPANDLPTGNVTAAAEGGSTWLKNTPVVPVITNISIRGVEGEPNQVGSKGGYIKFTTDQPGNYIITLRSANLSASRTLAAQANAGVNEVYWDGKDGNENPMPAGTTDVVIVVQLQAAEVHFPYIDMEYNTKGTVIERLKQEDYNTVEFRGVYWDDTDIPNVANGSNSDPKNNSHLRSGNNGISSDNNGHIWGVGGTGTNGQFGDQRGMDTYTFARTPEKTQNASVKVLKADLAVTSLTADKVNAVPGDLVTFTVKVKNNGPDAANGSKFVFTLPAGFTGNGAVFNGNTCGTQTTAVSYDSSKNTYSATLNLPNGCEVTYIITATAGAPGASSAREVKASILRPNDVTDPDATNSDPSAPLGTAEEECKKNGAGGVCNNIKQLATNIFCEISSRNVDVADNNLAEYALPPTDLGYQFDIRELDNSFNLQINGAKILARDIQFQSLATPGINIGFEDGTRYETTGINSIWTMIGTNEKPVIRVMISSAGSIKLYGSKVPEGPLFPLILLNGETFNPVVIHTNKPNLIKITQEITGPTYIRGRIYGAKTAPCVCFDAANTTGTAADTQVGITTLQRAGAENGNWPMVRKSGHIALESNDKGFVITRMTTAQINAIPTPVDGMMVFDTTANCLKIHNGSTWKCFSTPACL